MELQSSFLCVSSHLNWKFLYLLAFYGDVCECCRSVLAIECSNNPGVIGQDLFLVNILGIELGIDFDLAFEGNDEGGKLGLLIVRYGWQFLFGVESNDGECVDDGEGIGRVMRAKVEVVIKRSNILLGLIGHDEMIFQHCES